MLRRIVDFAKLTDEVLSLLVEKFPEGIDEDEIFSIQNAKGELIRVVEVRDEENIFLVKVSSRMEAAMEDFEEEDEEEDVAIDDIDDEDFDDTEVSIGDDEEE